MLLFYQTFDVNSRTAADCKMFNLLRKAGSKTVWRHSCLLRVCLDDLTFSGKHYDDYRGAGE
jgi:hypothetical protein